jgi:very-short-patch-repair endonuclease
MNKNAKYFSLRKELYNSKEWLQSKVDEDLINTEIGDLLGVPGKFISLKLKYFGIKENYRCRNCGSKDVKTFEKNGKIVKQNVCYSCFKIKCNNKVGLIFNNKDWWLLQFSLKKTNTDIMKEFNISLTTYQRRVSSLNLYAYEYCKCEICGEDSKEKLVKYKKGYKNFCNFCYSKICGPKNIKTGSKFYYDKEWLLLQIKKEKTIKEISLELGLCEESVYRLYRKYNIKIIPIIKNYSKISQDLFHKIYNKLPENLQEKTYFGELNKEFGIHHDKHGYYYDFVISSIKLVIEFNGDLWHANPKFYESSQTNINPYKPELSASDIWLHDAKKNKIMEDRGYSLIIVWENDYNKDPEKITQFCLDKIHERHLNFTNKKEN